MTNPKTYWLTDGQNNFALVTGATERDRWVPLGWAETDEPTDGFIHVWHEGIEKPGLAPVGLFHLQLKHVGWVAGPPEGGDHPAVQPPGTPESEPAPEAPTEPAPRNASKQSAAGGKEKE